MTAPGLFHLQHVAQRKAEKEDQQARDQLLDGARGRDGARHDGHGVLPGIELRYLIDQLAQLIYTQASGGNEGSPKSK